MPTRKLKLKNGISPRRTNHYKQLVPNFEQTVVQPSSTALSNFHAECYLCPEPAQVVEQASLRMSYTTRWCEHGNLEFPKGALSLEEGKEGRFRCLIITFRLFIFFVSIVSNYNASFVHNAM
ncbi:hypothetical protein QCA50_008032 [Cerrena zonata]|uniref:Uncharacterized protein n=1 Tax=Cerrena zonata TaxID=2478898 RepID=A0AAW0GER8_9APHY